MQLIVIIIMVVMKGQVGQVSRQETQYQHVISNSSQFKLLSALRSNVIRQLQIKPAENKTNKKVNVVRQSGCIPVEKIRIAAQVFYIQVRYMHMYIFSFFLFSPTLSMQKSFARQSQDHPSVFKNPALKIDKGKIKSLIFNVCLLLFIFCSHSRF